MDYKTLKLTGRQIRLMTIEPIPDGRAAQDCPVRCRMEARQQALPVSAVIADSGSLPPNYISFDHYVENPPTECFGASIRRDVAVIEENLAKKPSLTSRIAEEAVNKLRSRAGLPTSTREDIMIPVDDIVNLLTHEDFLSDIEDMMDMRIARHESGPKTYGKMPIKDLNPLFKASKPTPKANDPNNYVALSYAWGLEKPTETIFVNDQQVQVRENLAAALKQFRTMEYFTSGGRIWIDTLCINQDDDEEKQDQIEMMSMIYNLAGNIIVWLGVEEDYSSIVIDYLEKWSVFHRIEFIEVWDGSDPLTATTWRNMAQLRIRTVSQQVIQQLHIERRGLSDVETLWMYRFFDRPYWRRLWIIQELAMGRAGMPIVCGSRVTQWRYIRDALLLHAPVFDRLRQAAQAELSRTGGKRIDLDHPLQHVTQIAQLEISGHRKGLPHIDRNRPIYVPAAMREGPLHGSPLRQALLLASRALCFKAHDRVYGMLSIPSLPRLEIKVDYSEKVGNVFLKFSAACVANDSLDFFSLLDGVGMLPTGEQSQAPDDESIPSWVPDYAAVPERRVGIIDGDWQAGGRTGGEFPTFFGVMGFCFPPKVEGRTLICSAKVVDEVDGIGAVSKADLDTGTLGTLEPGVAGVKQSTGKGSTWPLAKDVLHKVLVGGCDLAGNKRPVERDFKSLYTAIPGMSTITGPC
jgi:hypothetical protein